MTFRQTRISLIILVLLIAQMTRTYSMWDFGGVYKGFCYLGYHISFIEDTTLVFIVIIGIITLAQDRKITDCLQVIFRTYRETNKGTLWPKCCDDAKSRN